MDPVTDPFFYALLFRLNDALLLIKFLKKIVFYLFSNESDL